MDAIELSERDICQGYLIPVDGQHSIRMEPCQARSGWFPQTRGARRFCWPAALPTRLIQDCGGQGTILPVSGYRTWPEQAHLFDDSLRRNDRDFGQRFVAFPDCSEHQTGSAVDPAKNRPDIDLVRPGFPLSL
jgi:D-alanyl-D-alanine dipeptidase/carboxypeptidase